MAVDGGARDAEDGGDSRLSVDDRKVETAISRLVPASRGTGGPAGSTCADWLGRQSKRGLQPARRRPVRPETAATRGTSGRCTLEPGVFEGPAPRLLAADAVIARRDAAASWRIARHRPGELGRSTCATPKALLPLRAIASGGGSADGGLITRPPEILPSGPHPFRSRIRGARRLSADPGLLRPDRPLRTQPGRRSPAQPRAAHEHPLKTGASRRNAPTRPPPRRGKDTPRVRRCLKRYLARQLYRRLETGPALSPIPATTVT